MGPISNFKDLPENQSALMQLKDNFEKYDFEKYDFEKYDFEHFVGA